MENSASPTSGQTSATAQTMTDLALRFCVRLLQVPSDFVFIATV